MADATDGAVAQVQAGRLRRHPPQNPLTGRASA